MSSNAVSGSTQVAAVIGSPVRHSLSPVIHNAAFRAAGLDWVYVALEVGAARAAEAFAGIRALGLAGVSVTTPHKDAAFAAVDEVSVSAQAMNAVNCIHRVGDRLLGYNTDGDGFVDSLRADAALDPAGHSVAVVGAGGAARSIIEALGRAGAARVVVVNRTLLRAQQAASLAGGCGVVGTLDDLAECDVVVNASSVGLGSSELSIPVSALRSSHLIADVVYHPIDTALLRAAESAGARTLDGLGMLVHQAARQFTIWTGVTAPVAEMRRAAEAALAQRR